MGPPTAVAKNGLQQARQHIYRLQLAHLIRTFRHHVRRTSEHHENSLEGAVRVFLQQNRWVRGSDDETVNFARTRDQMVREGVATAINEEGGGRESKERAVERQRARDEP